MPHNSAVRGNAAAGLVRRRGPTRAGLRDGRAAVMTLAAANVAASRPRGPVKTRTRHIRHADDAEGVPAVARLKNVVSARETEGSSGIACPGDRSAGC